MQYENLCKGGTNILRAHKKNTIIINLVQTHIIEVLYPDKEGLNSLTLLCAWKTLKGQVRFWFPRPE